MGQIRYYVYDRGTKRVMGPYPLPRLKTLPGFGPEIRVAPEGSTKSSDWKPAKEFAELQGLFSPPAEEPKPPTPGKPSPQPPNVPGKK
ncbi:MAG: hypothetical protein WCU88_06325 [Elusimicrobiota bacterium]|jgi:hypothetical protein